MKNSSRLRHASVFSVLVCLLLLGTVALWADSAAADKPTEQAAETQATDPTTSIRGLVRLPKKVAEGVDVTGIEISDATILLEGPVKLPRKPYPDGWRELTPEQRQKWNRGYVKSDAYKNYQDRMEAARAKREKFSTTISADGSFQFKDVKPSWYQLTVMIMPAKANDQRSQELARGHALRQFFVKPDQGPKNLGTISLKVKNVLLPGDQAPNWTMPSFDGKDVSLSDFKGKFVLFDFWATWCGPCKEEIPNLQKVHADFGGDRLAVFGINVDSEQETAQEWLDEYPPTFPQLFLGQGKNHEQIGTSYGFESIPSIWLIGPDGKVVARDLHGEALRAAVEKALAD